MELSTHQDIEAAIDAVFAKLTAPQVFEAAAIRHGAQVRHRATTPGRGLGAAWDVSFVMQGKARDAVVEVTQIDPPNVMRVTLASRSMEGDMTVTLAALSERRTRLSVSVTLRALSLPTRLLLKSLSLTKGVVDEKFRARVAQIVADFEGEPPTDA